MSTPVELATTRAVTATPPRQRRWPALLVAGYAAASAGALAAWALVGDRWWTQPLNTTWTARTEQLDRLLSA